MQTLTWMDMVIIGNAYHVTTMNENVLDETSTSIIDCHKFWFTKAGNKVYGSPCVNCLIMHRRSLTYNSATHPGHDKNPSISRFSTSKNQGLLLSKLGSVPFLWRLINCRPVGFESMGGCPTNELWLLQMSTTTMEGQILPPVQSLGRGWTISSKWLDKPSC